MSGPTDVVTIGDEPQPTRHEYALTLTFKAHTWGEEIDPTLASELGGSFSDWEDGRYPLNVEMIQHSLRELLSDALYGTCVRWARKKYGLEMVQTSPTSRRSRAYIEAEKEHARIMKANTGPRLWIGDEPTINIKPKDEP